MLARDIRYAIRRLWQTKGFATVAIVCLGFGIGVNTTIFSIIDGVLLQPYPYTDPDRLLVLGEQNVRTKSESGLSFLDLRDWKEAASAFTTIAATQGRAFTVSDDLSEPERAAGAGISWDLFPMLGVSPMLGRGFTTADDQANAGGVVLLSHTLWMTRYQSDPRVLGRSVLLNAKSHTIVGVMPPRFAFPENQRLWVPLTPLTFKDGRPVRDLFVFGRLKPGVTRQQALDDLNAISARLAREYPRTNDGWTASTRTLREEFLPSDVKLVLYLMMAGVTLVLFIACSNVANLLLSRAADRRREFAVRAAIGAGRGTIVRQLLTESVVLGLASVPLGLGLAEIGTRLIAAAIPADEIPYYIQWQVDWRTLTYAVAVAATTALVFGLFPALQVSRADLHQSLKEGTRGNSAGRSLLRSSLVVAQVSLALVALVGALLFVRTFINLDTYDVGFDTKPLMTMRYYMTGAPYEPAGAKARRVEDIVRRVEQLAGVQAAFSSTLVPISGGGNGGRCRNRRSRDRARRARADHVCRSDAAFPPHARHSGSSRTRFHRVGGVVTHTGGGRQPDHGAAVLAGHGSTGASLSDLQVRRIHRLVHGDRCGARPPAVRDRSRRSPAPGLRLHPVRLSGGAQYRPDDSGLRRSRIHHFGRSRGDPCLGPEDPDLLGPDAGRRAPRELLGIRSLRLDFRHDWGRRPAARIGWRVRGALVLRIAADAGDRRTPGVGRRSP
jgi:predicted permease